MQNIKQAGVCFFFKVNDKDKIQTQFLLRCHTRKLIRNGG